MLSGFVETNPQPANSDKLTSDKLTSHLTRGGYKKNYNKKAEKSINRALERDQTARVRPDKMERVSLFTTYHLALCNITGILEKYQPTLNAQSGP